jgi:hypothetical protein
VNGGRPGVPTFAELAADLTEVLALSDDSVVPEAALCGEVCADSLDLYCLYVVLDRWCPGFELPAQLELETVSMADVHHFLAQRIGQRGDRL